MKIESNQQEIVARTRGVKSPNFGPLRHATNLLLVGCLQQRPIAAPYKDCGTLQTVGGIEMSEGGTDAENIQVCEGYHYTACTVNAVGNPDLYGQGIQSKDSDQITVGEETIPRPDCVGFTAEKTDDYELKVVGGPNGGTASSTNLWIVGTLLREVPKGFEHTLKFPVESCMNLTNETYGAFGTPWGNEGDANRPFYSDSMNYVHGGADFACASGTPVMAPCDGTIISSNDAGEGWGYDTTLECTSGPNALSISIIHLNADSVKPAGTKVKAGDQIGAVYQITVNGEPQHFHMTICEGTDAECRAANFSADRGACRRSEWPAAVQFWINPDPKTNPSIWSLVEE